MLTKRQVTSAINDLPEKFTLDEIMQKMHVLNKIEKAREKSKQRKTFSTTQARNILGRLAAESEAEGGEVPRKKVAGHFKKYGINF